MFGHSFGGFAAAEAMLDDQRIDAGVNMDGHLFTDLGEVAERGLDHAVFLFGRQEVKPGKTVEHAGSKMYATASRRCTLLFPAFDTSTKMAAAPATVPGWPARYPARSMDWRFRSAAEAQQ
ncbi:hypothetical protein ACWDRB_54855 [Nonomuraea sp. NPDC003707]